MSLRIHSLGTFRVSLGEAPIPDSAWKTQKNKALLKILLTYRKRLLTKEQLLEWLWPGLAPHAAGRNLRVAVSQLRRVLEPDLPPRAQSSFVLTTDVGYAWNVEADYWLDAEEFERLAEARADREPLSVDETASVTRLRSVIRFYQGDYLAEDRYEDWATAERERLRELYFTLLTDLASAYACQGAYRRAVATCRVILSADRCRESVWCQLMLYHYHAGDRALALRAYRGCRQALAEELKVAPLPETTVLYEQIRSREVLGLPRAIPNNLPLQLTSFIGREAALREIGRQLRAPGCRLLTLVGLGGVGKTRLAIEAATRSIERFRDGVYLIPFANVDSVELLVPTIAGGLDLTFYGSQEPGIQLLNYLRDKSMLLILDTFEHLLDGTSLLVRILRGAPGVKLLVTSRESLKLEGEGLLEVGGLAYPTSDRRQLTAEDSAPPAGDPSAVDGSLSAVLQSYSAVQLFLQTAQRVHPAFALSKDEAPHVIRICQLVEGIPLAIELAAGWVRVLSCREIAEEIQQNLDLFETSPGDASERHRSLRATFERSWSLLSAEEKRVIRGLSVFPDRFSRQAAQEIAGASLSTLLSLVYKSLLYSTDGGRYKMHELLRYFAEEKLDRHAEEAEYVRERHRTYFADLPVRREETMGIQEQREASRVFP